MDGAQTVDTAIVNNIIVSGDVECPETSCVCSLFTLCTQFVADHLELVDSLVDFPDIVGKKIFKAAESKCRFYYHGDEYNECLNRLKLFTDAYGKDVLSKLSLNGRQSSIHLYKIHIQIFTDLTELELADCGLMDEDDLLSHIGQNLHGLVRLSLRKNKITDKGLLKLTTPYRVMGRGPGLLTDLNISDNYGITRASVLKYLSAFQELANIDITGTSVKRNDELLRIWKFEIKKEDDTTKIKNSGWAADVVNKWASQAEMSLESAESEKTDAQRFYSRKKTLSTSLKTKINQNVSGYSLVLIRIHTGKMNTSSYEPAKWTNTHLKNSTEQIGRDLPYHTYLSSMETCNEGSGDETWQPKSKRRCCTSDSFIMTDTNKDKKDSKMGRSKFQNSQFKSIFMEPVLKDKLSMLSTEEQCLDSKSENDEQNKFACKSESMKENSLKSKTEKTCVRSSSSLCVSSQRTSRESFDNKDNEIMQGYLMHTSGSSQRKRTLWEHLNAV